MNKQVSYAYQHLSRTETLFKGENKNINISVSKNSPVNASLSLDGYKHSMVQIIALTIALKMKTVIVNPPIVSDTFNMELAMSNASISSMELSISDTSSFASISAANAETLMEKAIITASIKQIIFFITCSPFIHMVWNIYEPILTKHWNPLLIYGLTIITIEGTNFGQRETIILRNF